MSAFYGYCILILALLLLFMFGATHKHRSTRNVSDRETRAALRRYLAGQNPHHDTAAFTHTADVGCRRAPTISIRIRGFRRCR
jgi:hypothetical protein